MTTDFFANNPFASTQVTTIANADDLELVLNLSPLNFDALTKILNMLQDNEVISIRDSKIIQTMPKGTTFFTSDITSIVGQNINIDFNNPKRVIKIFKLIKSANNIKIYDDEENSSYKVVCDEAIFNLAKSAEEVENSIQIIPQESELVLIGTQIKLVGDNKKRAKDYIGTSEKDYVDLLIEDDQLTAVFVPEDVVYHFDKIKNPNLTQLTASLALRSHSFLTIEGEEFLISLYKHGSRYLVMTNVTTNFLKVEINIYEYVEAASLTNLIL